MADLSQSTAAILEQSTAAILEQSTAAILEDSTTATLNESTAAIIERSTLGTLEQLPVEERPPVAFGHGTMLAGLVHRVAPSAQIMPLKAFRGEGTSTLFDVVRAVYYAVDHGARVVTVSVSLLEESAELKRAVEYAQTQESS